MIDRLWMMQVLSVASEAFPLVKTGGLGDVVGSLPGALAEHEVTVTTLLPGYPAVRAAIGVAPLVHHYADLMGAQARILSGWLNGHPLLVLDAPALVRPRRRNLWRLRGHRLARQLAALCRAWPGGRGSRLRRDPQWQFDLLHAHDWQAGMAPAYLRFAPGPGRARSSIMTIHNIAFQGRFEPIDIRFSGPAATGQ